MPDPVASATLQEDSMPSADSKCQVWSAKLAFLSSMCSTLFLSNSVMLRCCCGYLAWMLHWHCRKRRGNFGFAVVHTLCYLLICSYAVCLTIFTGVASGNTQQSFKKFGFISLVFLNVDVTRAARSSSEFYLG